MDVMEFAGACRRGWSDRLRMRLCEDGIRARQINMRRQKRSYSRLPGRRFPIIGKTTLLVLLAAATRAGVIASGLHGSFSGWGTTRSSVL